MMSVKSPHTVLELYLQEHSLRKTRERFAILDVIYSGFGHFGIDDLYEQMKANNTHVSLATLYNNIEILIDAGLLVKHQFDKTTTYEKAIDCVKHDHFVCKQCGKVYEISSSLTSKAKEELTQKYGYEVRNVELKAYGVCNNCKEHKTNKDK